MPAGDIAFTALAFPATGASTRRTMPDRLAEVKNVLDFGADPTQVGDSKAAIQAAVDAAFAAGGGVVFFPPGTYGMSGAVTFDDNTGAGITFLGATGAQVGGNFNGFLFDRHNVNSGSPDYASNKWVFEKLDFINPNTGSSAGCIRLGSCSGASIKDCHFQGQKCVTSEDSAGNSSSNLMFENCKFTGPNASPYLANGVILGGPGALLGCDFVGLDIGARVYGNGFFATGCRAENCNVGYLFGLDGADTDQGASGFYLSSSTEGDGIGIYLAGTCSGFFITGGQLGHDLDNSGYPTGIAATTHGIKISDNCSNGLFMNCNPNNFATVAGIEIGTSSTRANLVFRGTNSGTIGGGVTWELPTNAYTAFFEGCNVSPIWTFSQLPTGGNVLEGDEFNISDSTTATWGATVTGGGSNHVLVRYNGTNWTVVGK